MDNRAIAVRLSKIAEEIKAIDDERRRLIELYARDQMPGDAYISANRALDAQLERLTREKGEFAKGMRDVHAGDAVTASVTRFCESARARLQQCESFEDKRQFLVDYIEKVVYARRRVTIVGAMPLLPHQSQDATATMMTFRIEGEVDAVASAKPCSSAPTLKAALT